jgi:hypothetical protein
MSERGEEPDDDLIEPGIFLRLRRFAGWLFLAIIFVATPGAAVAICGIVLGTILRNVVMRFASRPRLSPG